MAQSKKSISFKNAMINMSDRTITEFLKDRILVYNLDDILKDWDGVEDICMSIQRSLDVEPDGE